MKFKVPYFAIFIKVFFNLSDGRFYVFIVIVIGIVDEVSLFFDVRITIKAKNGKNNVLSHFALNNINCVATFYEQISHVG